MPRKPKPKTEAAPKRGRPSKYRPEMIEQARRLTMMGQTMLEIAHFFDVHVENLRKWRTANPEFNAAFSLSLTDANAKVELSLFKLATGYWMDEEEIKVIEGKIVRVPVKKWYPPSTGAAVFWSKVKMGWRDDVAEAPPETTDTPQSFESTRQLARRAAFLLHQGGKKESA